MTLDQLANLGEFVGGFAVIASLLYLGAQIRQGNRQVLQNTKSLEAWTHQAIITDMNAFRALLIGQEELGRFYPQGLEDPPELSPLAHFRFRGLMQTVFSNLELQYKSRASGLFSLDSLDRTVAGIALAPGARAWWAQARYLHDSDFQKYVAETVAEHTREGVRSVPAPRLQRRVGMRSDYARRGDS